MYRLKHKPEIEHYFGPFPTFFVQFLSSLCFTRDVSCPVCSVEGSGAHQRRHPGGRSREDGGGADEPGRSAAGGVPQCCRPVPERAGQPAAAEPGGTHSHQGHTNTHRNMIVWLLGPNYRSI